MIVGEFDIGMTTSEAITACMEKAYVKHIDRANLVIIAKLNDGTEVYAPILYNCQHWLFQKDVTRFSAESAGKYGYTVVPFGEAVSLFSITRESGDREYYYIGNNTLLSGPMPARVPLCWPFLPRDEYFVVSSDERLNYNRNRHYPYIDKSSPQQDPLALVTPTFVDYEGTTKSPGTHEVPSQTTENPGRVFRIKGQAPDRHFVVHQPYEMWSKERKYTDSFFPTPVVHEMPNRDVDILEKRMGIFIYSGTQIGVTLDGIQYARTGWNYIPEKLILKAKLSDDCSGVNSCMHLIGNGKGLRHEVAPEVYDDNIVAFEIHSSAIDHHAVNLQNSVEIGIFNYANMAQGSEGNLTNNQYLLNVPASGISTFGNISSSTLFCASSLSSYVINSYICIFLSVQMELSNVWFYSAPAIGKQDAKVTSTITVDHRTSSYSSPGVTRGNDDLRVKLSSITLQIPYWVSDLYEFNYREDLDDTKGVLVYQDDEYGHLMVHPHGYFTHHATLDNESGSTHNYTDDWVVDQALIYKWNGQEVCREVRSGTSSASGTHTTSPTWKDWTGGSGTLTQSVTVTEIIWDVILPKYGFFVFWECEIFTDDEWGGAPSTATYRLYAWDNGTKTLLKTETKTVDQAAHDRLLHPHYYMQRKANPLGHDNHVGVFNGNTERIGCGIPRWQVKTWGSYPEIYYSAKEQIPQSVLDEWKNCEWNNAWSASAWGVTVPSVSMFEFYYRHGSGPYQWDLYLDVPIGITADRSSPYNMGIIGNLGSTMSYGVLSGNYFIESPEYWPDSIAGTPAVSGIKTTSKHRLNFGYGLQNLALGELLGEIYYANYAFDVEYYAGNSVELTRIKEAARIAVGADSQKKLRFWPQQT